MQLIKLYFLLL